MFRPCIDLHEGKVKQIVGGSLSDDPANLRTNFVSERPSTWYAELYKRDGLRGGHVIMLGPGTTVTHAAIKALAGNSCLLAWTGQDGVKLYAHSTGATFSARRLIQQARLASDVLEVRRQALTTLDRHLEDAHRLRAAGQIARTEELRAEVAHAEADRDYKKARRDVDLAAAALRATLGVDDDVVPTTPLAPVDSLEPREAFWVAADSGNPGIARLAALEEQARQGTRAVRAEYLPAVSLFGQQELLQNHLNTTTDPKWVVGVAVRWDLFDGFGREHRFSAARRLEEAIGLERASARRDVRTLVEARYDDYRSAVEQHASLETSLALAQESLHAESRAFAAGVGTSLAVVDAELALSRIEVGRLTAMYDMDVALARLLEASGKSDRVLDYLDRANGGTPR